MMLQEQLSGAVTVLRPEGPLAGDDAVGLKTRALELMTDARGRYVIDTSAVPYVDSRGLEVLVEVNEAMFETGHVLKLCGTNETVRQAMELTDLAETFEFFADVPNAVRSFL